MSFHKTRIAPTPSGFLHLGNLLSFAITTALAKRHGASTLLRIDDIDKARTNPQYIQDVFDTLNFLEIPWQEGPRNADEFEEQFSQLYRMGLYNNALYQLLEKDMLFACICSRQQMNSEGYTCNCYEKHLPVSTENASWRMLTAGTLITIKGIDGKLKQQELPAEMNNFIVRKKDGFPAYQLTSVVDDLHYGIDLVVRGQDLWPSTLAQQVLASALNAGAFKEIAFYHHPLIVGASGNKLSKSAGATSIKYLRENGKTVTEVYALAAEIAGIAPPVTNWEQLGNAIII